MQVREALQGLIHVANTARRQGLRAVPDQIGAPLEHAFRHGVILGLSQVPTVAGRKQQPFRDLLECLRDRTTTCCGSSMTWGSRPPPTRPSGTCGRQTQQKISGRLPLHGILLMEYFRSTQEFVNAASAVTIEGAAWENP